MSNNGGGPKAVVPFGPKLNGKSEAGDELDRAGQAILGVLRQAVGASTLNDRAVHCSAVCARCSNVDADFSSAILNSTPPRFRV